MRSLRLRVKNLRPSVVGFPDQIKLAFRPVPDDFFDMSFTGTVEHGMVKLPPDIALPDGTQVRIEPLEKSNRHRFASEDLIGSVDGDGIPATNERVKRVMGCKQ